EILKNNIPSLRYIIGDATEDVNFDKAGLERAQGIILTLPDEKDNLFCVISLMQKKEQYKNDMKIAAKVTNWEKTAPKLEKAGADIVISPHYISGRRMVSEMFRPSLTTFLDRMLKDNRLTMRMEEVCISKTSFLANKKLSESRIRENTGLAVIAVRKKGKENFTCVPEADLLLEEGDFLITIGDMEKIKLLRKIAGMM
ncbi:MAG: NAD-binding protein, partial [Desulfotignum sp.]|nr:NAD-binding protein [Desulfotignum sp.]